MRSSSLVSPRWVLVALLALTAGRGGPAAAAPEPEVVRLPSGLELLVRPVPGATQVALVLLLKVGEHHDPQGQSGLAHLAEHCFVTAAAGGRPARTVEQVVARYPGGHTAQTSDRATVFGQVSTPDRLDDDLQDLAARLSTLDVTAEDLAREKPRLLLEVGNMFDRVPGLAAMNRARERALPNPAGGRRGGLPAHVEALSLENVRSFLGRYYRPRNAVLAIAGALEASRVQARVSDLFGALPPGEVPVARAAPMRAGTASVDLLEVPATGTGEQGRVTVAYPAPAPGSPTYAAFLVLTARLLDPGPPASSGFPPPVYFAPLDEPGALYVSAPLAPGQAPEDAVAAVHHRVRERVMKPYGPSDAFPALNRYGALLGLTALPNAAVAQNPYLVALSLAACRAYGIDAAALRKDLVAVRQSDLPALAARVFDPLQAGAAVVRVR